MNCAICGSPERAAIDEQLVRGASCRAVASRFGHGKSSVAEHKKRHLIGESLRGAMERVGDVDADGLLRLAGELREHAARLLGKAERERNYSAAIAALRELRGHVELLGAIRGAARTEERRNSSGVVVLEVSPLGGFSTRLRPEEDGALPAAAVGRLPPRTAEQLEDGAPAAAPKPETAPPPPAAAARKESEPSPLTAPRPPHKHGPECDRFTCVELCEAADEEERRSRLLF